ncbi:DNA translocase ftsK [Treponema medium ATCC 700293]|uniref:DNA translocase ftsK n=3 Tax=Treponema medium TaxID=58231 RepID=A0AA87TFU3_TREMD|nr:DNA translocase ftsK [Treponema medium ATCC 700293]
MMGNRDSRFRVLAVILSVLFFCAGIILTLGIFLPVAGLAASHYALFAMGQRVFFVYGFSSFLIPLLFLYGAVLLLIPGWSRESKAILLGVPLYFVTAIIGEQLIYTFAPSVSIPTVRQFVTVSILICALLLVCFEIFLMLTLSEKLSGKRFSLHNSPEEDDVSENDEATGDDMDDATAPLSQLAPAVEKDSDSPEKDTADSSELPEATTKDAVSSSANTADDVMAAVREPDSISGSSTETEASVFTPSPAAENTEQHLPSDAGIDSIKENTSNTLHALTGKVAAIGVPELEDTQNEISQTAQQSTIESKDTETPNTEEELPLLEEVEEDVQPLPLSTPLSAVMDMQEKEAIRPVFDPSDPNNLFASLEEITAPVERIKQTDHSEAQSNPLLQEEEASPMPTVENVPTMADSPEAPTPVEEETLPPENDVPATAEEVADAVSQIDIIPEETISEQQSIAAAPPQAEPEMPLVFVNGVPLPNERSDLLDTMVVIDSEPHTNSKTIQEEQSTPSRTGDFVQNKTVLSEIAASIEPLQTETSIQEDEVANSATIDIQDTTAADTGGESIDVQIAEDDTETDIGADADIAIDGFDAQDEEAAADAEVAQDTDEEFLETIEQTVPVIPTKPVPPPPPRKKYAIPFDLLTNYPDGEYWIVDDATRRAALMLKSTFNEFKIDVSITGIRKGPVVTMFEMLPSPGIKLSKITNLQDNIALRLAASSVRIVAPIPGKHAVGIEVPNKKRSIVSFRELIETDLPEAAKMAIPVALGKDVTGNPQVLDLAQTPHLLIAGATGSGKSVCVNSIILSILYNRRPDEVKLILVDPKIVELKLYNDIAHLLTPVITEPKRAFQALQYALCEMERRYALLDNMGVRDIKTFNAKIKSEHIATETLPYIVIIIDEFADLMATSGKELEATVARLCAMSRAVGIHLVLATQRPSIDVITGLIKANIPSRIAFMVASKTDSRIILDEMGAEKLLGKGDMLYVSAARPFPTRIQGAFVSEQEVERVVACVKEYCEPEYIDEEIFVDDDDEPYDNAVFSDDNDPLYDQALEIVTFAGKASASYVQRKLKIGYNRAARLIEEMEARGIVGPANGSKAREIIRHV